MEKSEIVKRAASIKDAKDLAHLLCDIKTDEFHTFKHKITEKQLLHFCNPKIAKKRYKTFAIPKKRGGMREISSPNYQLRCILYVLNVFLKSLYTPRPSTMGFVEGRSVASNADVHKGHNYVLNIDLSDFFPSIRQARVWKCLQLKPFCFSEEVARIVAGLCCNGKEDGTDSVLPQGAATSPLLSNIVCQKLDRRLEGLARRFGLHYSRYADDMTFSSMHNVYKEDGEFMTELRRIVKDQGFVMNEAKTRLLKSGSRQEVTGLIVNEKVNVTREYIRLLRFLLFKWQNEGYAKAYALFYRIYKQEKGYIKKGEPVMENVISGKLDYLKMIKGEHDHTYKVLNEWYNSLQQIIFVDTETDKQRRYIYVQPYSISEFEQLFGTTLKLEISKKKKIYARCLINGKEKTIAISQNSQPSICPDLNKLKQGDTITSDKLKECYITLCQQRGRHVKNFWLITRYEPKRSKCLSLQNVHFDNAEIDTLLDVWANEGIEDAVALFSDAINGGSMIKDLTEFSISTVSKSRAKVYKSHDSKEKTLSQSHNPDLSDLEIIDVDAFANVDFDKIEDLLSKL